MPKAKFTSPQACKLPLKNIFPLRIISLYSALGKISAQPHTIVKQIYGNVLFLSLFSLSKNWMHNVVWGCAETQPCKLTHSMPDYCRYCSIAISTAESQKWSKNYGKIGSATFHLYLSREICFGNEEVENCRRQVAWFGSMPLLVDLSSDPGHQLSKKFGKMNPVIARYSPKAIPLFVCVKMHAELQEKESYRQIYA